MLKNTILSVIAIVINCFFFNNEAIAQAENNESISKAVSGLELRSIGPALMGGRIADIAVSPQDKSTWYVAVGSGGLWKTTNRGISWKPVLTCMEPFHGRMTTFAAGAISVYPFASTRHDPTTKTKTKYLWIVSSAKAVDVVWQHALPGLPTVGKDSG